MANIEFFLQGVHPTTTTYNEISNLFSSTPSNIIFSTAYLRSNAVLAFHSQLSTYSSDITFFVEVDNGVTSYQALMELYNIGVNVYTVDTGSSDITYHPKVYIAQGASNATIIIGSSNFTGAGISRNFEGNVVLSLDLANSDDLNLLNSFTNSFNDLETNHPSNVTQINNISDIDNLFLRGKLEDEHASSRVSTSSTTTSSTGSSGGTTTPRIRPRISPTRLTSSGIVAPSTGTAAPSGVTTTAAVSTGTTPHTLVWRKENLAQSDAQYVPPGSTSNRTGNLRLAQAQFRVGGVLVDKNTYFRNDVFGSLTWGWISSNKESATATFTLDLAGTTSGPYNLVISHNLSRVAGQANVPTILHWGEIGAMLQAHDYRNYNLELYQYSPTNFHIRIYR